MLNLLLKNGAMKFRERELCMWGFVSFYFIDVRKGKQQREREKQQEEEEEKHSKCFWGGKSLAGKFLSNGKNFYNAR